MATCWYVGLLALVAAVSCVLSSTAFKPPRMVGVPVDVDIENDPAARAALNYAINEYNKASNDKFSSKVSKVHSVTRQLVSGMKYVISAEIARTTCTKSTYNAANCALSVSDLSKPLDCKFEVHVIPWMNKNNLLKHDCQ